MKKEIRFFIHINGKRQEFIVKDKGEIFETDWSKLESTKDTNLTLITCVENKPEKRLYVRAKLKQ